MDDRIRMVIGMKIKDINEEIILHMFIPIVL